MAGESGAGTIIAARYRLDVLLGEGGMGVVWEAEAIEGERRRVAIKVLRHETDNDGDAEARRRFLREGRTAQAVVHPNVVEIFEVLDPEDGPAAIVMELLHGESLGQRLRRDGRIALPVLAAILAPAVSAVGAAHALGVVHRDLKPENIFIARGEDGATTTKVLDFGIAKRFAVDEETARTTGIITAAVLGTPAYMAPEQVFAEDDLDHGADVWALGIILYQCLSGVLPTRGDHVGTVLKNVLARPFEPIEHLCPELPRAVADLVGRMLARDRELRPADLREVGDVLAAFTTVRPRSIPPPLAPPRRRASPVASPGPPTPPAPRGRRRPRGRAAIVAGTAAGLLAAGALAVRRFPPHGEPSLLGRPENILACPLLRAAGVDEPAGWLGAAAAATACERARVVLGGRPERTLVPAELLHLPRQPVDRFPADPYGAPDARERSLEAARRGAAAYLDGEVARRSDGFAVALELRGPDGALVARGRGSGVALYQAVRAAQDVLLGPAVIPWAAALDPGIAAWSRTADPAAALAALDLTLAFAQNGGGLGAECTSFIAGAAASTAEIGAVAPWLCAFTAGRPAPPVDLGPDAGATREVVATRIRIRHFVSGAQERGDADRIHRLFEAESSSWGRALLAAGESCLVQSADPRRAHEMAIVAVHSEPKNPDGLMCYPWGQLLTMAVGSDDAESVTRAMQAWVPWNDTAWLAPGLLGGDPDASIKLLRRAYVLSPYNTVAADVLVDRLLRGGERKEARAIALALRRGGLPVHDVESDLLLLRVDASEARFAAAIERAGRAVAGGTGDAGWVRVQRFEAGWRALELAAILGTETAVADRLVDSFVEPEPPVLDSSDVGLAWRLPALCALASPARSPRCFERLKALRAKVAAGISPASEAFAAGAERYARGDLEGAARQWRPLLRGSQLPTGVLSDAMADVFDRAGDIELAERVDELAMRRAGEFNGATLAHARVARRALRRGDRPAARARAEEVIAAWSVADDKVPVVAEMRRIADEAR